MRSATRAATETHAVKKRPLDDSQVIALRISNSYIAFSMIARYFHDFLSNTCDVRSPLPTQALSRTSQRWRNRSRKKAPRHRESSSLSCILLSECLFIVGSVEACLGSGRYTMWLDFLLRLHHLSKVVSVAGAASKKVCQEVTALVHTSTMAVHVAHGANVM